MSAPHCGQVRNIHFTMAKPWELGNPHNKGYERLNQLWVAAYSEPRTLCRMLLRAHQQEKRDPRCGGTRTTQPA